MEVLRFDFNGTSGEFKRTPQGFLRVSARLTKTGVFSYDSGREYRSEEEVFRADSLESLRGAPVTDLHPSEKGFDGFLTPANVKEHIVGVAEGVERDGPYLKGSLLIFHEDAIKAIECGDRKEISLGYKCRLEPIPGSINGEAYDVVQRDIIVNHIAIGPTGWGRAGAECSIKTDSRSQKGNFAMGEVVRLDGVDVPLTPDGVAALFSERKRQYEELRGRFDAIGLELEQEKAARAALEEPKAIEAKVQARLKILEQCRRILGDDVSLEEKSDQELKVLGIKRFYADMELSGRDQSYIDGVFEAICNRQDVRNDSLASARQALCRDAQAKAGLGYEKWFEHSGKLWTVPLTGSLR